MGEFFKEEKKVETKAEEFIDDPQELFTAYNTLKDKVQLMRDDSYEAIMPIRTELMGTEDSPQDSGQINYLRRRLKTSRISNMTIGTAIWSTLKNIEDLDRWSERYIDYTEKYFDSYQLIARSSFRIISNLNREINKLQNRINEIQQNLPQMRPAEMQKKEQGSVIRETKMNLGAVMKKEPVQIEESRIDIFETLINEKVEGYRASRNTGDEEKVNEARRQLIAICGKSQSRIKKVEELITRIDLENNQEEAA